MALLFLPTTFIFGLIIGSFLNSVIYRLEEDMPVLKWQNRSMCPHCKKQLAAGELVPLVSFIIQHGRCRGCREKISWQYPLVELATGILFFLAAYHLPPTTYNLFSSPYSLIPILELFYLWVVASLLLLIVVFDYKYFIIPNQFVYTLILLAGGYLILTPWLPHEAKLGQHFDTLHSSWYILDSRFQILNSVIGSTLFITLLITGFFLALVLVSRGRWMGMGDVKYAVFMGLFLGWPHAFTAFTLSFILGAIISLILMSLNRKNMQSEIPFGPFLILGTLLAFFWGNIFSNLLF